MIRYGSNLSLKVQLEMCIKTVANQTDANVCRRTKYVQFSMSNESSKRKKPYKSESYKAFKSKKSAPEGIRTPIVGTGNRNSIH